MRGSGKLTVFIHLLVTPIALCRNVVHEKREEHFRAKEISNTWPIEQEASLPMRIALKQDADALRNAEAWLMAASDPDSSTYGQHWTQESVISTFQPSKRAVEAVSTWLHSHGVLDVTHSDNKQWLAFDLPVRKAEDMFKAKYFERHRQDERGRGFTFEAFCDQYSIPAFLRDHVDFVKPGVQASDVTGRTARSRKYLEQLFYSAPNEKSHMPRQILDQKRDEAKVILNETYLEKCRELVTADCIRALYDIPLADPTQEISPNNTLGVFAATGQLYYQGSLDLYYSTYAPYIPTGTAPIFMPIDDPWYPPTGPNSPHWKDVGGEGNGDLESAMPIIYPQNASVFEVSTGYTNNLFNRFVDAIDGSFCIPSQRANSTAGREPQCGIYKPTNVITVSFGSNERQFSSFWRNRQCLEYLKLGLQGVSLFFASGDYGVSWMGKDPNNICLANGTTGQFAPSFPADCPWVTAVGATQIAKQNATAAHPEVAAAIYNFEKSDNKPYLGFSSGGGFSIKYNRPAYQETAVLHYFKTANPPWPFYRDGVFKNSTGKYNRNGRGYPDIAANGQKYALCGLSNGDQLVCNYDSGTSISTPISAAIFNRINEERIRAGKSSVGFINPTIYKHPEAFHDIVKGGNGSPPCKQNDGFECAQGWDPVTGLGTPNYPKLLEIFMQLP